MLYRRLGGSGIRVSAVGMGAWAIGGWAWGGNDEAESIAAVRAGLEAGINLIDTAPAYGLGRSEEVVGRAVKGLDRDSFVLATKCGLTWHKEEGSYYFVQDGTTIYKNLRPSSIRYELEQSLKRLGQDHIDLYQTHWQVADTPICDTMAELVKLRDEGKIRAIGASNAGVAEMQQYMDCGRLDVNQPPFSMLDRAVEANLLPFCRENDIAVLAYSPLAQGLLTGRARPERVFAEGDLRAAKPRFAPENVKAVNAALELMAPLREKYGMTQTQLTIMWTISRPGLTCALVGVRRSEQSLEAAGIPDTLLTAEEMEFMDKCLQTADVPF